MKVRELIALLSETPMDAEVVVLTYGCGQESKEPLRAEEVDFFEGELQIDVRAN